MATHFRIKITVEHYDDNSPTPRNGNVYVVEHERKGIADVHQALSMADWLAQTDIDRRTETVDCPGCDGGGTPECNCTMETDEEGVSRRRCGVCDTLVRQDGGFLGKCGTFEVVRK